MSQVLQLHFQTWSKPKQKKTTDEVCVLVFIKINLKKKQLQKKINKKIKHLILYSYYLLEDRGQGPHCLHK